MKFSIPTNFSQRRLQQLLITLPQGGGMALTVAKLSLRTSSHLLLFSATYALLTIRRIIFFIVGLSRRYCFSMNSSSSFSVEASSSVSMLRSSTTPVRYKLTTWKHFRNEIEFYWKLTLMLILLSNN